jgi:ribosomal protein S18 acetylase RimI-like enzyme
MRLRPLREDELPAVLERQRTEYRTQLVEWAGLSEELADRKAAEDTASRPEGLELKALEADDGRRLGTMFFAERRYYGEPRIYLYDLWVEPAERGCGYGRAAMEALEAEARSRGLPVVEFNVWGGNAVARSLYRSLGYEERSVFMGKNL